MKNRRGFLTALTVCGTAAALPPAASGRLAAAAPPSSAALAFATTFRAFDPTLSEAELHTIAHNIDTARAAARALHTKSRPFPNSTEMVVRFTADEIVVSS